MLKLNPKLVPVIYNYLKYSYLHLQLKSGCNIASFAMQKSPYWDAIWALLHAKTCSFAMLHGWLGHANEICKHFYHDNVRVPSGSSCRAT